MFIHQLVIYAFPIIKWGKMIIYEVQAHVCYGIQICHLTTQLYAWRYIVYVNVACTVGLYFSIMPLSRRISNLFLQGYPEGLDTNIKTPSCPWGIGDFIFTVSFYQLKRRKIWWNYLPLNGFRLTFLWWLNTRWLPSWARENPIPFNTTSFTMYTGRSIR